MIRPDQIGYKQWEKGGWQMANTDPTRALYSRRSNKVLRCVGVRSDGQRERGHVWTQTDINLDRGLPASLPLYGTPENDTCTADWTTDDHPSLSAGDDALLLHFSRLFCGGKAGMTSGLGRECVKYEDRRDTPARHLYTRSDGIW